MHKILISGCLIGQLVRFDGNHKLQDSAILKRWQDEGRLVPVCPEVLGGLGVPRPAAEIQNSDGKAVLQGQGRVQSKTGEDITAAFQTGAKAALEKAVEAGARLAILKENSPSCGVRNVYDGTFSGVKLPGQGVTSALLSEAGLAVFSEHEVEQAHDWLTQLEAAP
jgi:uncharacterized protein YbbK (DUF523 family)